MIAVELLRCPACSSEEMETHGGDLSCPSCNATFGDRGGWLDLLDAAHEPIASTPEQRLMESELVARIYERFWRPAFVRVFAGGGASSATGGFSGEFFIHKNALGMEDREGPWLDLSCGPGNFTRAMASSSPGAWVVGLDISRAMLEVAAKRSRGYSAVALVRADAHDLPFRSGSFVGVNNSGALHVYDDPEAVFNEVMRVIKPGGVFVGGTFAPASSMFGRIAARVAGIRRFDPKELRVWLSRVGFADYEEIRLGDAFIFRVRKP
jgi:SAM-dependent methyltransferase